MADIVVFAPTRPGDESLAQARWIAERNILALQEVPRSCVCVVDDQAHRQNLEKALATESEGVAFFGHGRLEQSGALMGADGLPALDRDNITLLRGRWVHAFACSLGSTELPVLVAENDARCFAAYRTAIYFAWRATDIPAAIRADLEALVSSTTVLLARGVRDIVELKAAAQRHADSIENWCIEQPDDVNILPWVVFVQSLASLTLALPAQTDANRTKTGDSPS